MRSRGGSSSRKDGALLLDSGEFLHCPLDTEIPLVLTPRDYQEGIIHFR